MPEIKRDFEGESAPRERDPQQLEFQRLFQSLAAEHGTGVMLKYIESVTDVATKLTSEWLENKRHPSSGIRKAVINSLRNFKPDDLPKQPEHLHAPLATAKPDNMTQPSTKSLRPQEQRREQTIAKNEAELKAMMDRLKDKGQIT